MGEGRVKRRRIQGLQYANFDGIFKGVEGKVCRVKKDRRVVVTLEGVCSVAISCISPYLLEDIQDESGKLE